MKKHIIFGGFDYAVYYEMNHDAIYWGIDYFVDNDPKLIGTTYMGKPIYSPDKLLEEDKNSIVILIGSIIYHLEIEFQLKDMGFEEDKHYQWAISFQGDEKCSRLWHHIEWNDTENNESNLKNIETGLFWKNRLKIVSGLIPMEKFDTIVDLGGANGRIREFLPDGINYIPVDYIKYLEETIVCDLNNHEFPQLTGKWERTCILLIGTLQYVNDWRWILRKIS